MRRDGDGVSIECWIAVAGTEAEVSSASIVQFLGKHNLRGLLNDLLIRLDQSDRLVT